MLSLKTTFTSSGSEMGKKRSKITGRAGEGTDYADADGEIFFSYITIFSRKKEKKCKHGTQARSCLNMSG